jgi:hypothetical protein
MIKEKFFESKQVVFDTLTGLKDYLDLFLLVSNEQIQKQNGNFERILEKLSKAEQAAYVQQHYDDTWYQILTSQFYSSFVVWSFATFEELLSLFCMDVKLAAKTPIGWTELKGSKIEQARKYLHTLVGFTRPQAKLWDQIEDIYLLRNLIVHNGGFVFKSNKEKHITGHIVKVMPGLELEHERIKPKAEFCIEIVRLFVAYFQEAFLSLESLCEQIVVNSNAEK